MVMGMGTAMVWEWYGNGYGYSNAYRAGNGYYNGYPSGIGYYRQPNAIYFNNGAYNGFGQRSYSTTSYPYATSRYYYSSNQRNFMRRAW